MKSGALPVVMRLTESEDVDTQLFATMALANFSSNEENFRALGEDGAMAPLVALCTFENPNCMCLAVAALRRLLEIEANRLELVRLRGLGPLAAGGLSYDKETKRE